MEVKEFSFDQVNILARLLATRAKKYNFTHIIGIARGGLVPAAIMSYELDLPLITCSVSSYTENEKGKLKINDDLNLSKFSKDSNLLVVDDICDSGETIKYITNNLTLGGVKHKTACIFTKEKHKELLDHYGIVISDNMWIVFPWE